jgi:Tfp pilus assembly protein PilF
MDRIDRLKEFLATAPQDCFVKHALALEYIKIGDDATAKQLFEEVLQTDENYIGSYYHLAKLLERTEQIEEAISVYEKGMAKAKEKGEQHAFSELRSAYEELTF